MMFWSKRMDARKHYRNPFLLGGIPVLISSGARWIMGVERAYRESSPSADLLLFMGIYGFLAALFLGPPLACLLWLYYRTRVARAVPGAQIFSMCIGLSTWNKNVCHARDRVLHPNYNGLQVLVLEESVLTVRTGVAKDVEAKVTILYSEISKVEIVRVSSVMSTGPGIRLTIGGECFEFQPTTVWFVWPFHFTGRGVQSLAALLQEKAASAGSKGAVTEFEPERSDGESLGHSS